jgi:hypothetical protein
MPTCRLCGQERPLIDAHIIPQGFHPEPVDIGPAMIVSNTPGVFPKRSRTGPYDQHILCAQCDGKLGALDQHATEKLLDAKPTVILKGRARRYDEADAKKVLDFFASVAWRASVSNHEMFRSVDLGPYEAAIGRYLSGAQPNYPIAGWLAEFDVPSPPYLNPHSTRFDGVRFLVLYAARFIFYLKTDQKKVPKFRAGAAPG